jgi:hypothetical protein
MILIWEDQQSAGHVTRLQDIEGGKSLGDREAVIKLIVHDQLGRSPGAGEGGRVPLQPCLRQYFLNQEGGRGLLKLVSRKSA